MPRVNKDYVIKSRLIGLRLSPEELARIERFGRVDGRTPPAEIRYRLNRIYDEIEKDKME